MAVLPPRRHPALRAAADAAGRELSQVEVVRRAFAALEQGGVEAFLPFVHPEFCGVVPPELSAEPDSYDGLDGIRRYFELFEQDVDDLRFVPEEILEEGGAVLAPTRIEGQGRSSGIPVELSVVMLARLREGKIAAMTAYRDLGEARAAL